MLGILRGEENSGPVGRGGAGTAPVPGLAALADLVRHTAETGVRVDLEVCGERRELSPGLDLADDQTLVRGSFRVRVDTAPDLATVGEAASGEEAVAPAGRERPDVVLMDIRMPGLDGIEATRRPRGSGC